MLLAETRGEGEGLCLLGVFLQMDAFTAAFFNQRCAPQITRAESRKPQLPQRCCLLLSPTLPSHGHTCPGPCLPGRPPPLRASLFHSREGGELRQGPLAFPRPRDTAPGQVGACQIFQTRCLCRGGSYGTG